MRRIFTSAILAAALIAASTNSFAQCSSTQPTSVVCSGTVAHTFNAASDGFTSNNLVYQNQRFERTSLAMNTTGLSSTFTSPTFIKTGTMPGAVNAGVLVTMGTRATLTGVTLDVLDAGTSAVISTCTPTISSFTGSSQTICIGINDPADLTVGRTIRYRFTFTYNGDGNPVAERFIAVDNFSYGGNSNAALPVKFISFDAKQSNNGVSLLWNVAVEENLSHYEVERSSDNRSYTTIGSVTADAQDAYSFVDSKPSQSVSYYRIKGVDIDGKLTYSTVVTMKGGKSSITLRAFPMPANNQLTLQHTSSTTDSEITISSVEGREVKSVIPAKGSQQTTINISSLRPGMYVVRFSNANGDMETLKIVKQ